MIGSELSIIAVPSSDGHLSPVLSDTWLRARGEASSRCLRIAYLYYKSRLKKRRNLNFDGTGESRGLGINNGMLRQHGDRKKVGDPWKAKCYIQSGYTTKRDTLSVIITEFKEKPG
jgi:hypothetical protein